MNPYSKLFYCKNLIAETRFAILSFFKLFFTESVIVWSLFGKDLMVRATLAFAPFRVFVVALVWMTTFLAAAETCPDPDLCKYYSIYTTPFASVWIVPEGEQNVKANAIPSADFLVYAPNDTLILNPRSGSKCSDQTLSHPTAAVTSDTAGLFYLCASSAYPISNAPIGVMSEEGKQPTIFRYWTFYVPSLEFSVVSAQGDTAIVDRDTKLSIPVDSAVTVVIRAVIPVGPDSGKTDTVIHNRAFYLDPLKGSEKLSFKTLAGNPTDRVILQKGVGAFLVEASGAVSGSSFGAEGLPSPSDSSSYFVSESFPGNISFENPDLPSLDSAFIYDADGDGKGDSIIAYFSGKTDSVSWDSIFYSWPNGSEREFSGDYKKNSDGSVMELLDVPTQSAKDSAQGNLKVHVTSKLSGTSASLETAIIDRIGPAIEKATLIAGVNGANDTLVIDFNKEIDPNFKEGSVLQLSNGDKIEVTAISRSGSRVTFVTAPGKVSVGDSLSVVVGLGDLGLVAADGNVATYNRPVKVSNAGRVYLSNENNGFFDSDADGRMDSVTIGFENPITEEDLGNMQLQFYWKDEAGNELIISPDSKDLVLSKDGKIVSYSLSASERSQVQSGLTSIDSSGEYGYAALKNVSVVNGDTVETLQYLDMNDRIAPVVMGTFLSPESKRQSSADGLKIRFSEPIDTAAISNADFLGFVIDGDTVRLGMSSVRWNDDLTEATIRVGADEKLLSRANPNDSLFIEPFALSDFSGNSVPANTKTVSIEGDPRVVLETASMVGLDRVALSSEGSAFTERLVPEGTSLSEELGKSLGVMLDVAFATIFDDSTGQDLDLEKIGLHWTMDVYTNLGAFVAGGHGTIRCDDAAFDGNCFENAKRLYLRWNMRTSSGRKVGVGAYLVQFSLKVYGLKKSYTYDKILKWGVHGGVNGLALD